MFICQIIKNGYFCAVFTGYFKHLLKLFQDFSNLFQDFLNLFEIFKPFQDFLSLFKNILFES